MSDYIAPVAYDNKDPNALVTKQDMGEMVPVKYWGQQLPEGGTEITGGMSGVTSIVMPVSGSSNNERFIIKTDNLSGIVISAEMDNGYYPDYYITMIGPGVVETSQLVGSAITVYADHYTQETGTYHISPYRPAFIDVPLTGQCTFSCETSGSEGMYVTTTNHFYWTFDTGDPAPTITWSGITAWYGGSVPTIQANKHYEVSVLGHYNSSSLVGVIMEV